MEEYQVVDKPVSLWRVFLWNFFLGALLMGVLFFLDSSTRSAPIWKGNWAVLAIVGGLFSVAFGLLKVFQTKQINLKRKINV